MSPADEIHILLLQETSHHIRPEDKRHSAVILSPKEVTDHACIRNVSWSNKPPNLIHVCNLGTQSAMHANDLFIDKATHWEAVEDVAELLPKFDVVTPFA